MHPDMAPAFVGRGEAGLYWGIKSTFLRYVSGLPDGVCEVSPVVRMPGGGIFGFPLASSNGSLPASFRFAGTVTFRGHHDFLYVQLSELGLDRTDGRWELTSRRPGGAGERIVLATVPRLAADPASDAVRATPALAPKGAELFGGNYPVGEPLSELVLKLPKTTQLQRNSDKA